MPPLEMSGILSEHEVGATARGGGGAKVMTMKLGELCMMVSFMNP